MIPLSYIPQLFYGVVYLVDNKPINESFLQMLRLAVEGGQAAHMPLDTDGLDTPDLLHSLKLEPIVDPDCDGMKLVARRINLGSLGKNFTVTMKFPKDPRLLYSVGTAQALLDFGRIMLDVTSISDGDVVIDANKVWHEVSKRRYQAEVDDIYTTQFRPSMSEIDMQMADEPYEPSAINDSRIEDEDFVFNESIKFQYVQVQKTIEESRLEIEEKNSVDELEEEQRKALEQLKAAVLNYVIKFQKDPSGMVQEMVKGKYFFGKNKVSPLVVNGDMELVLPGFDEVVVTMPPMMRSIYILFLRHQKDGIILKHFGDYRKELEEIYDLVMPNRDEKLAKQAIDNLCNPASPTLKEYISKIKRCFNLVILDENVAGNYHICGKRGQAYSIPLDPDLVTLPRALKM